MTSTGAADGSAPALRNQAFVAALQWGLVQAFVLDSLARFLRNYYRATTDQFLTPDWVFSIQLAILPALLIGGYGGYRWVTGEREATTAAAHRARVVFVGALLVSWALAIVPTIAFGWLLGDRLFTVPYFLLPSVVSAVVLVGAYVLAYRVQPDWLETWRGRLLGGVQGALCGLVAGVLGFVLYGSYLAATRSTYELDGGPGIVAAVGVGALVGYALVDSESRADRAAEFVVLLLVTGLLFPLVAAVGQAALWSFGPDFRVSSFLLYPLAPLLLALVVTTYLTYGARTTVYRRVVGRLIEPDTN